MMDARGLLGRLADRRLGSAGGRVEAALRPRLRRRGRGSTRWFAALTGVAVLLGIASSSASAAAGSTSAATPRGIWNVGTWSAATESPPVDTTVLAPAEVRSTAFTVRAHGPKPKRISPASAFALPPNGKCVHTLTVRVRTLAHITWRAATVYINGRKVKTIKGSQITRPVTLTRLPRGRFVLLISAKTTDGRSVSESRGYKSCAPSPGSSSHRLSITLAGAGAGSVSGSGINCPGTCSHTYTAGTTVTLGAAPASGSSFTGWSGGGCSGTGTCTVTLSADQSVTATFATNPSATNPSPSYALSVTLAGSGSGTVTGSGISCPGTCSDSYPAGTMVTLTATPTSGSSFTGWTGGGCSGTGTCTVTMTAGQSVTATFATGAPSPGSYTVSTSQSLRGGVLYVSNDGTELRDVSISTTLGCTPSNGSIGADHIQFPSIAIGADGSFNSGPVSETGEIENVPAAFTYTLSGQFTATHAAGSIREDVTFNNGTAYSCTTNPQTWSATRDTQGSQTTTPAPGSYTVTSTYQSLRGGVLYVSNDGTKLQDVSISTTLGCTPSDGSVGADHIQFPSIAIGADGSFDSGPVNETGEIGGVPATFTYAFSGNFHGTNTSGIERIAGQIREDVTFNNGTAYSCTTNPQTWSATRDTQGSQTTTPAPGSYTVTSTYQSLRGGTFTVSGDGTELQNVSVSTSLGCTPSNGSVGADHIQFASIAIGADGSFNTGAVTVSGEMDNTPATFTYAFSGNFHGTNSSGHERAAGQLREDVVFNNGTAYSCTTNPQTWAATGP